METVPKRILRMYHRVLTEPQNVDLVAHLAVTLAHTGSVLRNESVCADIASTGGAELPVDFALPLVLGRVGLRRPQDRSSRTPCGWNRRAWDPPRLSHHLVRR